ncbi:MAG: cupin domain-containing protein [Cyanosarcina radialis HA8281-LM2]|jgi:mannose-6-phosphate isomerase-like protein (cupin superfamily)|nr:cupin domain-containing protein [Cyanosarcina radialis HA8281-LM2]
MNKPHVIPVQDYRAYRISPESTNRLALVFDPESVHFSIAYYIEIFDVGGQTSPHRHQHQFAIETFFVLKGEGVAICDGEEVALRSGDTLLVPPTGVHGIRNTGAERLYTLTVMVPNEDFAELIRNGIPVELDAEDLAVLQREPTLP